MDLVSEIFDSAASSLSNITHSSPAYIIAADPDPVVGVTTVLVTPHKLFMIASPGRVAVSVKRGRCAWVYIFV